MAGVNLKQKSQQDTTVSERDIDSARANLSSIYRQYLERLDEAEPGNWSKIIGKAREAGLSKEELCQELSCAWSTILRWENGQTVPGPFARRAIKEALLRMLDRQRKKIE